MSFGQPSGPPATARQIAELLELLEQAGHTDFRDARGPMGFTQRQAGGKFTRDEADEFIAQLQEAEHGDGGLVETTPPSSKSTPADRVLRNFPDQQLAAELQRRGWVVMEP